jgi:pyruvate dehydrogenase complex dehydrogenase (E1) component
VSTATCSASTARCAATAASSRARGLFAGAGWNVIKVLWGSDWDRCSRATPANVLRAFTKPSTASSRPRRHRRRFNRERFFNKTPELQALVAHLATRTSTACAAAATTR